MYERTNDFEELVSHPVRGDRSEEVLCSTGSDRSQQSELQRSPRLPDIYKIKIINHSTSLVRVESELLTTSILRCSMIQFPAESSSSPFLW